MPPKRKTAKSTPTEDEIEGALRYAVKDARRAGTFDQLTANTARAVAERKLGLEEGWLRQGSWKARSKDIIKDAAEDEEEPSSPVKEPTPISPSRSPEPVRKKRANGDRVNDSSKRRKTEEHPKLKATKVKAPVTKSDASDLSEAVDPESEQDRAKDSKPKPTPVESESELSDVIDEPAPKRKRSQANGTGKTSRSKKETSAKQKPAKASKDVDLPPDEAEIKRLQGWLVKCGIRKLWHKELALCDSSKSKIRHLKGMLEDVGMTGRYSQEKATAIKERRELAAELDAVTEGNKAWGNDRGSGSEYSGEESVKEKSPPPTQPRKAASRFIDFGSDEDD